MGKEKKDKGDKKKGAASALINYYSPIDEGDHKYLLYNISKRQIV